MPAYGLWLMVKDTGNRAEWRRRTHVADPSPEGFTTWRRERDMPAYPMWYINWAYFFKQTDYSAI